MLQAFRAAYGFINEYKLSELKQLKEELKTTADPTRKSQIKYLIQRMVKLILSLTYGDIKANYLVPSLFLFVSLGKPI